MSLDAIFIDGDFRTPSCGPCEHHCWPSCHPAQVGPQSVYGCTHKAWPQNRAGDFVPIVGCGGELERCELPQKFLRSALAGKNRRLRNLMNKIAICEGEIRDLREMLREGAR